MANWRMSVPVSGARSPFAIPNTNRSYACASGSTLDVPDFDAALLVGQGWVTLDRAVVANTAARPVNAAAGVQVLDATVGARIVSDGKGNWIHHATGALV